MSPGLTRFLDSFGAVLLAIIWISPLLFAFFDAPHAAALTVMVLIALGIVAGIQFIVLDRRTHYQ